MLTKAMLYMLEKAVFDARSRVTSKHRFYKEFIPGYRESYEKKLFYIQEAQDLVTRMRLRDNEPVTKAELLLVYALIHNIKQNS